MKFKIGDTVQSLFYKNFGEVGTIIAIKNELYSVKFDNLSKLVGCEIDCYGGILVSECYLKLLDNNDSSEVNKDGKNIMTQIIDKIKLARKNEPEKSLIKSGLMDKDEKLTQDGIEVLNDLIYQDYKDKLKVVADEILKEQEDKK